LIVYSIVLGHNRPSPSIVVELNPVFVAADGSDPEKLFRTAVAKGSEPFSKYSRVQADLVLVVDTKKEGGKRLPLTPKGSSLFPISCLTVA
jgi:hypothetical protein